MTIVRGKGNKFWGKVEGTTYLTARNSSHYCRRHEGYGIQLEVFNELEKAGITDIIIRLPETNLYSTMETWKKYGRVDCLRPEDGEQMFLSDREMRAERRR